MVNAPGASLSTLTIPICLGFYDKVLDMYGGQRKLVTIVKYLSLVSSDEGGFKLPIPFRYAGFCQEICQQFPYPYSS